MHHCTIFHGEGLKHALIVGACLSVVTFPGVLSAPANRGMSETVPKWKNPCGGGGSSGGRGGGDIANDKLLQHVIEQAKIATTQETSEFQQKWVFEMFQQDDFNAHHQAYINQHYDWLPSSKHLHKNLKERVPQDHLETLELKSTLQNVYTYLQKVAVGLEQVIDDEEKYHGQFATKFQNSRDNLCNLLCEMKMVMEENDFSIPNEVSEDIMSNEVRNMEDKIGRRVRNWIIYREYLNLLEYTIQVFEYLKEQEEKKQQNG